MTTSELRSLLLTAADALETGQESFPYELDDEIVELLQQMDERTIVILAALLQMPVDKLKKDIPNVIKMLQLSNNFFESGQAVKIAELCRNLAGRPFVLNILVRFI